MLSLKLKILSNSILLSKLIKLFAWKIVIIFVTNFWYRDERYWTSFKFRFRNNFFQCNLFKVNRNIHIILPTKCFNASKAELRGSWGKVCHLSFMLLKLILKLFYSWWITRNCSGIRLKKKSWYMCLNINLTKNRWKMTRIKYFNNV